VAWLDSNGLSLDEAARIQPDYGYYPPAGPDDYVIAEGVAGGVALIGVAINATREGSTASRQVRGGAGVGLGMTSVIVGAIGLSRMENSDNSADEIVGSLFALTSGTLSVAFATVQLSTIPPRRASTWSCGPWLRTNGRPGVLISARF
jgi:hypothetical protein